LKQFSPLRCATLIFHCQEGWSFFLGEQSRGIEKKQRGKADCNQDHDTRTAPEGMIAPGSGCLSGEARNHERSSLQLKSASAITVRVWR
jgi:hypothetical protein